MATFVVSRSSIGKDNMSHMVVRSMPSRWIRVTKGKLFATLSKFGVASKGRQDQFSMQSASKDLFPSRN